MSFLRIAVGLVLLVGAGCGHGDPASVVHDGEAARYVRELPRRSGDRTRTVVELSELLPSTRLVDPAGRWTSPVTALVVGRIESVERGRAFDQSRGYHREVDFDSTEADWRTLHLLVAVEERLGPSRVPPRLHVALSIGLHEDVARLIRGLPSLGRVLVPVVPGLSVYDHDPPLYGIAWDGELLGTIDDDGRIRFPWLDVAFVDRFLDPTDSLAQLRAAAALPPLVIPVDASGTRIGGR